MAYGMNDVYRESELENIALRKILDKYKEKLLVLIASDESLTSEERLEMVKTLVDN